MDWVLVKLVLVFFFPLSYSLLLFWLTLKEIGSLTVREERERQEKGRKSIERRKGWIWKEGGGERGMAPYLITQKLTVAKKRQKVIEKKAISIKEKREEEGEVFLRT